MDFIEKTKALRDEAWQAVLETSAYTAFKSLDDAVQKMTGKTSVVLVVNDLPTPARPPKNILQTLQGKRITQADVAERVLRRNGEPLPIGRWLEASVKDGINIKGPDPLPNFRSTVSRDKRFYNFTRNNMYFWWLDGVELPESWKEAAEPNLLDQSAASDSSNQEGGDDHAANVT